MVGSQDALNEVAMARRWIIRLLFDKRSSGACAVKMSIQAVSYSADEASATLACIRAILVRSAHATISAKPFEAGQIVDNT